MGPEPRSRIRWRSSRRGIARGELPQRDGGGKRRAAPRSRAERRDARVPRQPIGDGGPARVEAAHPRAAARLVAGGELELDAALADRVAEAAAPLHDDDRLLQRLAEAELDELV